MSNTLDKLCFVRDLVTSKNYDKLKFHKMKLAELKEEIHRHIKRKSEDYKYNLEFTAQDLRETAQDIRSLLKRWETAMCPEKNIKEILKRSPNGVLDIAPFYDKTIPIMTARTENIQVLTELLSILEYHGTYLYILELIANDEFAINCTERLY